MSIHHHPDDATLLAYAAGAVSEGFSLVLAAHAERCPRCRARLDEARRIGGALLDDVPEEPLADEALSRIWERIAASPTPEPAPARRPGCGTRSVLDRWLPRGLAGVHWRGLVPGIRDYRLEGIATGRGTVRLLSIAPGTTIPHHTHVGSELTLVLRGSFVDEVGRFRPGDLAELDEDVAHQPVADTDEPCVCLIATDARLRFTGMLGRVVQPLVGI